MIKIKPHEIAFDIDGVVADTMSSFIKVARKEFGINSIRKEQITSYWLEKCLNIPEDTVKAIIDRILENPFSTGLSPIEGAVETLEAIAECCPVYFVTARPLREPIVKWLHTVMRTIPPDRIIVEATGRHDLKPQVLKELGKRYFVEDHLDTCKAIHSCGLKPIVFDQPWNQGTVPFLRITDWEDIGNLLELD